MLQKIDCGYKARKQFIGFHMRGQRFACLVCHRRAGKTVASIADLQDAAIRSTQTRPRFAYVAPFLKQAKTVAWDYLRASSLEMRNLGQAEVNETELRVDYLANGSQVRLYGSDNMDALRGIGLDGVVLDEFADMDPRAWAEVIRPALADRKGWAVFIGTPKGRNSFYEIYKRSLEEKDWYSLLLKASETGLIDREELELSRRDMTPDQYQQEYECSFDAATVGAYYARLITQAETDKRICGVPHDAAARVWTAWDLGFRDATAVWFYQLVGKEVHLIDYHESVGADITQDVRVVQDKGYNYAGHVVPHDAYATEKQTGKTTAEYMEGLGLRNLNRCPDHRVEDGISNVQLVLSRCWFDKVKTERGVDALRLYRAEYDDKARTVKARPLHDWTSHAADAFRYLAVSLDHVVDTARFHRKIVMPQMSFA